MSYGNDNPDVGGDAPMPSGDDLLGPNPHRLTDQMSRPSDHSVANGGSVQPEPIVSNDASGVVKPRGDRQPTAGAGRISGVIAVICSLLILFVVNFSKSAEPLLLQNSTPSGGDMGAHVWGPAFLRDNLLPSLQLAGWSGDWYGGLPVYRFYMVIPALAIVFINVGIAPGLAALLIGLLAFWTYWVTSGPDENTSLVKVRRGSLERYKKVLIWAVAFLVVLLIPVPYGVAFKLVAVAGVVTMPLAAYGAGRLARAPEPISGLLAIAATIFVFDATFSILGGNMLSTLAGEFSFSLSLSLMLLAIGLVIRSLASGKQIVSSAVVIALVALCHVIPFIYLMIVLLLIATVANDISRSFFVAMTALTCALIVATNSQIDADQRLIQAGLFGILAAVALVFRATKVHQSATKFIEQLPTFLKIGVVAAGLASFWLVPFLISGEMHSMFNDMGWERTNEVAEHLFTIPMQIALAGAVVGLAFSVVAREKLGMVFGAAAVIAAVSVANLGQGALWNERVLPLFYLSIYMACAIGLGFMIRALAQVSSRSFEFPNVRVTNLSLVATFGVMMLVVLVPLRGLPEGFQISKNSDGEAVVGLFDGIEGLASPVEGWVNWNFSGYENKRHYREYYDIVSTMRGIGAGRGCGRAMWEYDKDFDRFGTPMALMLLPYWTDSCIASMEGLYFESSQSTPFHFLNQSVLSDGPSRAQRHLPYLDFDIDVGVRQLQQSGVRYYLATSDRAIEAARNHPELTQITSYTTSREDEVQIDLESMVIFEVAGWDLVQPLEYYPVVTGGLSFSELYRPGDDSSSIAAEISSAVDAERGRLTELGVAEPELGETLAWFTTQEVVKAEREAKFEVGWIGQAVDYYNNPGAYLAIPAESGPAEWPVAAVDGPVGQQKLPSEDLGTGNLDLVKKVPKPATVSNVSHSNGRVSFEVDEVGAPVLVKMSYYPNFQAKGGDIFRAGPNQMVVVPTDTSVTIQYTSSWAERLTMAISAISLVGVLLFGLKQVSKEGSIPRNIWASTFGRFAAVARPPSEQPGSGKRSRLRWFAIVGAGATFVDVQIFMIFADSSILAADVVALTAAAAVSYFLNRFVTFGGDLTARWVSHPMMFFIAAVAAGLVDLTVVVLGNSWGWSLLLVKAIAVGVSAVVRWFFYRKVLFDQVRTELARKQAPLDPDVPNRLSVVLPAFNEAERIATAIGEINQHLGSKGVTGYEIIVVDDGSADDTAEFALQAGATVVRLEENQGKGAAVQAGIAHSSGQTIVFTDSDLAYPPRFIVEALELIEQGWEVVVGNRRHRASEAVIETSFVRRVGGWVMNRLTHIVLLGHFRDTQCGIKAFRSHVGKSIAARGKIKGFSFDVEIFLVAEQDQYSLTEMSVAVQNRDGSSVSIIGDSKEFIYDLFRIRRWAGRGDYLANSSSVATSVDAGQDDGAVS